jgi:molybdate transport system substrate-binding protein
VRRLAAAAALVASLAASPAAGEPLVFAAASTARAMDAVVAASGIEATLSYGPSGTLARQIAAGAPADLFLSANPDWMRFLVDEGIVDEADVRTLLSNALVLIVPAEEEPVALEEGALADRLDGERFAMADPATAPVGQYGQAALTALGLWPLVASHLAPTRNTLVTVATVGRAEAPLGLVYKSDALDVATVAVAAEIPADAHPPIAYPVARLEGGTDPKAAGELMTFLSSAEARAIFERHGFRVVDAGP